jgi:hypothetical protein
MKLIATGGTDGATILLFWPDNFPEGADVEFKDDAYSAIERFRDEGKLIFFPCDGDGDYTLAVFWDSEVPTDLMGYCKSEQQYPMLHVRGTGYFGGGEYIFKDDSALLDKFPAMCQQINIPDGTYVARVYTTDVPESIYESWLLKEAGVGAKLIANLNGVIVALAFVGVLGSLISLCFVAWTLWFYIVATTLTLVVLAVAISRTKGFKAVRRAKDAFEKEYPSFVVHLERIHH